MTRLVDAHWGTADSPLPDWRKVLADDNEPDDDEDITETPPDVIAMLGFDPLEFNEDDDEESEEADDALAEDWLAPGETSRRYDAYGRLHVTHAHISKATVNNYFGREIPNWQSLGLQPDRQYRMLRDPDELARAADTFNNIPLMSRHVAHSAADHKPDLVIGSTGSHAAFEFPYLNNNLVVWAGPDIAKIEQGLKEQLSCSYAYKADMTPGSFKGENYDGRMTDIVGNHVAVVVEGRAGPDVLIGDSAPESPPIKELLIMANTALSRKAIYLQGASIGFLAGKLAADAKPDLSTVFEGVTSKNYVESKPAIVERMTEATKGKLKSATALEGYAAFLGAFDAVEPPDEKKADDEDDDETEEEKKAREARERKADDKKARDAKTAKDKKAKDGENPFPKKDDDDDDDGNNTNDKKGANDGSITKEAMDEALKATATATEARIVARMRSAREAEQFVRPWVGQLAIAYDSAEEIERAAAVYLKIPKADTIHASALRSLIELTPKPGERQSSARTLASDSRSDEAASGFAARFPNAQKVRVL